MNPLIIIGDGAFAEIAYEYFSHDSDYEVIGFAVEEKFISKQMYHDLPVIPFEKLKEIYPEKNVDFFVAIPYNELNRLRTRLYLHLKNEGFNPASYVSSKAFVWPNVEIGEHCFIFEGNVVQPFTKLGNNIILWSGNHIGHHSNISDNCFISSHVVISGYCDIGKNTFIGVNSTLANNIVIGEDNWIGMSVSVTKSSEARTLFKAPKSEISSVDTWTYFKIKNELD